LKKEYEWQRFWCPPSGRYSLADGGFLVDPMSPSSKYYESTALKFDDIPAAPCLVLLGEPGIGKTKALDDIFSAQISDQYFKAAWMDLRSHSTDVGLINSLELNPLIQAWLRENYHLALYLDSLDEGLLNVKTTAAVLIEMLSRWPRKRLTLRLACRTADWPKILDSELSRLFDMNEIPKYELLPLRRIDVRTAADAEGIDPRLFVKDIQEAEVTPFAIRPVTLRFLLDAYKRDGHLPKHKSEIYWSGCLSLCEEKNENRLASKQAGKLTPAQRIVVAARIAAVMTLSNKSAVSTGSEEKTGGHNDDVDIRTLSGFYEEVDGIKFNVDEDAIRETLGTGLFNSRGQSLLGFSHQTYSEYLAAYYLLNKRIPTEKVISLITHDDGKIIPQLEEVAVWLSAFSEAIFSKFLPIQPDVMARTSREVLAEATKKKLVRNILRGFQTGKINDQFDLVRYFDRLCFEGIASLLAPYIRNRRKSVTVRRVAVLIAGECRATELLESLLSIALDNRESQAMREYAAHIVYEIGDENLKKMLLPLALGTAGGDPDDELKGIGLKALWETQSDVDMLLKALTPLKNPNLIGTYYGFLSHDFSQLLHREQLPSILKWLLEKPAFFGSEIAEESLIRGVMLKAWEHIDDFAIAEPFSRLAHLSLLSHLDYRGSEFEQSYLGKIKEDVEKRHALVERIVGLMDSSRDAYCLYFNQQLVFRDDVDWIIGKIDRSNSDKEKEIWIQLLSYLIDYRNKEDVEKAFWIYEQYPAVSSPFSRIFAPVDLNSDLARQMREVENQNQGIIQAKEKRLSNQTNSYLQLLSYVEQFNQGDMNSWWKLNLLFLGSDPEKRGHEFEVDLAEFSLWKRIDSEIQRQLVSISRVYLNTQRGEKIHLENNRISRPAISAFRAFYLLATHDPENLDDLSADVWTKWAPVILAYPVFGNKPYLSVHQNLVSRLLQASGRQFYTSLKEQIIEEEKRSQDLRVLGLIEHLDSKELQETLLALLEGNQLSPQSFGQLLQFLIARNNHEATEIAFEIVSAGSSDADTDQAQKRLLAANSLIHHSENAGWPLLGELIKSDVKFGEKLFQALAYERRSLAIALVSKLSEQSVVELYEWLEKRFPAKDDPEIDGFHEVSERENVGQFRDSLIHSLAEKGNEKACKALELLIKKFPDKKWISRYLHACEENTRRNTWMPYAPYALLEITRDSYREHLLKKRKLQNLALSITGAMLLLMKDLLMNLIDYENSPLLAVLAPHQIVISISIVFFTVLVVLINWRRPMPD